MPCFDSLPTVMEEEKMGRKGTRADEWGLGGDGCGRAGIQGCSMSYWGGLLEEQRGDGDVKSPSLSGFVKIKEICWKHNRMEK